MAADSWREVIQRSRKEQLEDHPLFQQRQGEANEPRRQRRDSSSEMYRYRHNQKQQKELGKRRGRQSSPGFRLNGEEEFPPLPSMQDSMQRKAKSMENVDSAMDDDWDQSGDNGSPRYNGGEGGSNGNEYPAGAAGSGVQFGGHEGYESLLQYDNGPLNGSMARETERGNVNNHPILLPEIGQWSNDKLAVGNGRPSQQQQQRLPPRFRRGQQGPRVSLFQNNSRNGTPRVLPEVPPNRISSTHLQIEIKANQHPEQKKNEDGAPHPNQVSVGTQTESEFVKNYSQEYPRGTYQVWFMPEYKEIRWQSQPVEASGFANFPSQFSDMPQNNQFDVVQLHTQMRQCSVHETMGVSPPLYSNGRMADCGPVPTIGAGPIASDNGIAPYPFNGNDQHPSCVQMTPEDLSFLKELSIYKDLSQYFPLASNAGLSLDDIVEMNTVLSAIQMLEAGVVPSIEPDVNLLETFCGKEIPVTITVRDNMSRQRSQNQRRHHRMDPLALGQMVWRGRLLAKDSDNPQYSEKIFVGGFAPNTSMHELHEGFSRFGSVDVAPCQVAGGCFQGCAYVTFNFRRHARSFLRCCTPWISEVKFWKGQPTLHCDLPLGGQMVQVEVIPWDVNQSEYSSGELEAIPERERFSIFVGNMHARFSAKDLKTFFKDQGINDVIQARIITDKNDYPVGYAKVTFGSFSSFSKAIHARRLVVLTPEFYRSLQLEPFIDTNHPCYVCKNEKAICFCRNRDCCNYYCGPCYHLGHREKYVNHLDDKVQRTAKRLNKGGSF